MKKSTKFFAVVFGFSSIAWGLYIIITKQIHQDTRGWEGPHVVDASETPLVAYAIGTLLILVGIRVFYLLINYKK